MAVKSSSLPVHALACFTLLMVSVFFTYFTIQSAVLVSPTVDKSGGTFLGVVFIVFSIPSDETVWQVLHLFARKAVLPGSSAASAKEPQRKDRIKKLSESNFISQLQTTRNM